MKGFPGIASYQKRQREFVMKYGYILLNPLSQHKAYIYDFEEMMGVKKRFDSDFWTEYKMYKGQETQLPKQVKAQLCLKFSEGTPIKECTGVYTYQVKKPKGKNGKSEYETKEAYVTLADAYVYPVKYFFKRKAASEKQAINYPMQATGAVMFKTAMVFLWDYLIEHNLLFKVKFCIPAHDEINLEVPESMAEELTKVVQHYMAKAGKFFCRRLELPADGAYNDYWVH